jgi:hypothetical protein
MPRKPKLMIVDAPVDAANLQTCTRLSARLMPQTCAKRWCMATSDRGWRGGNSAALYESCATCPIGKANAQRYAS